MHLPDALSIALAKTLGFLQAVQCSATSSMNDKWKLSKFTFLSPVLHVAISAWKEILQGDRT